MSAPRCACDELRAENEKLRAEAAEVEHFQRQRAALNLELKTAYDDLKKANERTDALRGLVDTAEILWVHSGCLCDRCNTVAAAFRNSMRTKARAPAGPEPREEKP